jgi:hypothetical protein
LASFAQSGKICAFTPNATGRQDPIQSERRDAYRANFSWEKTGDKFVAPHFRRARSRGFVPRLIRLSWNISTLTRISRDDSQSAFNSVATEWHECTFVFATLVSSARNRYWFSYANFFLFFLGHVGRLHFIIPAMRACNRPMSGYSRLTWTLHGGQWGRTRGHWGQTGTGRTDGDREDTPGDTHWGHIAGFSLFLRGKLRPHSFPPPRRPRRAPGWWPGRWSGRAAWTWRKTFKTTSGRLGRWNIWYNCPLYTSLINLVIIL